jgi:hypothetical protein
MCATTAMIEVTIEPIEKPRTNGPVMSTAATVVAGAREAIRAE